MDDLATAKRAARTAATERRAAARAAPGADLAEARAQGHLMALFAGHPAAVVSGYWPMRSEIDPVPVMAALFAAGRRVALPVIEGKGRPLLFRDWRPGVAMVPGPFGAAVPASGETVVPQALIVPLLAFSGLHRLGYGGGFYDRTLATLRAALGGERVLAVGFAFAAQEDAGLPLEPTDAPLDALVTEEGTRRG